jgi:hypothetical protein
MITALGGAHEVVVRSSWHALNEALSGESMDGCVVDADHPGRDGARAEIEAIREKYPTLAIITYADVTGELEYYDLGELGVDGLLLAGQHGAAKIRYLVDQAMAANSAIRVAHELEGRFGTLGSRAVAWSIEHATSKPSVEQFAAAMGRTRPVGWCPRYTEMACRARRRSCSGDDSFGLERIGVETTARSRKQRFCSATRRRVLSRGP